MIIIKEYYCFTPKGDIVKRKVDFSKSECLFDFMIGNVCDNEKQCKQYEGMIMEKIKEQIENCKDSLMMIEEYEREI